MTPEYTKNHSVIYFEWVNYIVCELYYQGPYSQKLSVPVVMYRYRELDHKEPLSAEEGITRTVVLEKTFKQSPGQQ